MSHIIHSARNTRELGKNINRTQLRTLKNYLLIIESRYLNDRASKLSR